MTADEFWRMTWWETRLRIEAAAERDRERRLEAKVHAFHVAGYVGASFSKGGLAKVLEDLKKEIEEGDKPEGQAKQPAKQHPAAMLATMKALAAIGADRRAMKGAAQKAREK